MEGKRNDIQEFLVNLLGKEGVKRLHDDLKIKLENIDPTVKPPAKKRTNNNGFLYRTNTYLHRDLMRRIEELKQMKADNPTISLVEMSRLTGLHRSTVKKYLEKEI